MTEEQVKQIVADMISSGELKIKIEKESTVIPSFGSTNEKRTKLTFRVNHNKNGYTKSLFETTISI